MLEAYVTKNYKLDKGTKKKKKKELEELVRERTQCINTYTEPVPDLKLHTPELIKT